jgi:hypothetical protein
VLHDIRAPPDVCMTLIRDFNGYVGRVPKIRRITVEEKPGSQKVITYFKRYIII